jgi:hypothetical protein
MRHWIEMFANDLLTKVATDQREEFLGPAWNFVQAGSG